MTTTSSRFTFGRPPEISKYNLSGLTVRFEHAATKTHNVIPFTIVHEQDGGLYGHVEDIVESIQG